MPNQNSVMADVGVTGSPLPFCNTMPWNPVSKVIEIVAGDHNGAIPDLRHLRYVESTNQFIEVQAAPAIPGIGHGYDHNSVNPFTGDLYHRRYDSTEVLRKVLGGSAFSNVASWTGTPQVAIGTGWWSGSFAGGGAQGSLIIFNSGNAVGSASDGQIVAYNPLTNTWFFSQTGMAPFYGAGSTYSSVFEYSAGRNVGVYGGGNAAPRKLWRLNADRSFTVLTDVPAGKGVGMQQGLLVNEPVTGNFLLLSAGELWELNPTGAGTWTQQTGSRTPPAGVGNPSAPALANMIAVSISDHNVVAFITQPSASGGTFFLYKHQ